MYDLLIFPESNAYVQHGLKPSAVSGAQSKAEMLNPAPVELLRGEAGARLKRCRECCR